MTNPYRPLAVEELLRLQSMSADWIVDGTYRDQVRQVGNATPALLAEVLGSGQGERLRGLGDRAYPGQSAQLKGPMGHDASAAGGQSDSELMRDGTRRPAALVRSRVVVAR